MPSLLAMKPVLQRSSIRVLPGAGPDASSARLGDAPRRRRVRMVLAVVLVLNLIVAVAKIAFGLAIGSLAISADGFHSLLDGAANVVALVGIAVAARPPDPNHPYGHHHYETLTSLGIAALMLFTVFEIVQGAWDRFTSDSVPTITAASFAIMLGTLSVNLGVTFWERREGRRLGSALLIADAKHTSSDVLVSCSVIVSLVLVSFGVTRADAAISLVIAGAICWGAWAIVRDATLVLTDATSVETTRIEDAALSVDGVRGTHNIRSRDGEGRVWVDLHIQVDPSMTVDRAHDIASKVAKSVEAEVGDPADVTVHVEPADAGHLREVRGYDPGR